MEEGNLLGLYLNFEFTQKNKYKFNDLIEMTNTKIYGLSALLISNKHMQVSYDNSNRRKSISQIVIKDGEMICAVSHLKAPQKLFRNHPIHKTTYYMSIFFKNEHVERLSHSKKGKLK